MRLLTATWVMPSIWEDMERDVCRRGPNRSAARERNMLAPLASAPTGRDSIAQGD